MAAAHDRADLALSQAAHDSQAGLAGSRVLTQQVKEPAHVPRAQGFDGVRPLPQRGGHVDRVGDAVRQTASPSVPFRRLAVSAHNQRISRHGMTPGNGLGPFPWSTLEAMRPNRRPAAVRSDITARQQGAQQRLAKATGQDRSAPETSTTGPEFGARVAAVRIGIDVLLDQVAELRVIRLRQLAAARSGRPGPGAGRARARSRPVT